MQFASLNFLVFFPVVSILFFVLPHKYRWVLLLGASYFFYVSWGPKYVVVLLAVTAISYLAGLLLGTDLAPARRRFVLGCSLIASLGILFFFKYFSFANQTIRAIFNYAGLPYPMPDINPMLPVGISYFTLQTMSYTIDVFRGTVKPEKHAGIYSLFVSFFPQIVAGPIGRAHLLLPQYYEKHAPDYEKIVSGLQRIAWGFFKKLVIADRLALLVNTIYGDPTAYTGLPLILATYAFAFQIYCDFSGYADIAIGAARVMGFSLTENFQQPYYARSIPDFWRRWHISLYNWLRDYIFYPLRRMLIRKRSTSNTILSFVIPPMVTMLVSGLWHGANWNFIVWGGLHGIYLLISIWWDRGMRRVKSPFNLPSWLITGLNIFVTFNLVSLAWIFFRASSLSDAFYIVGHLFAGLEVRPSLLELMPGGGYEWTIALIAIILMEVVHWLQRDKSGLRNTLRLQPVWLRWSIYFGLVVAIFVFGKFESTEFIYSRF